MNLTLQAETTRVDSSELNADTMYELRAAAAQRGDIDVFVAPAWVTLKSELRANDGKDCFVVAVREMTVDELYANGAHTIYAGAATLVNGNRLPCLMLGNGAVAISADIVLDAHLSPGETLLVVFDCKDGLAVLRAPFTAELATQLQALVASKEYLPREPVDPDGVCPTRTRFPIIAAGYFGF